MATAYNINPMVGVIDGFRWCILGGVTARLPARFHTSIVLIIFFLWLGLSRFRKMEKTFADII